MNDLLDLPPIVAPVTEVLDAAPAQAPAETAIAVMRRTTLAELSAVERGIAKLKADHGATDYDINTPKGLQAAKDHRLAVREVRYQIPHTVKARKTELKEVAEALDSEAERITAALLAIEKPHDDKIKAREKELADEKAERERIAAERAQKQADGVAGIRAYLSRAQTAADMTAERVGNGIKMLEAMTFSADDWLDPVAAANAQCETLEGLRTLQATLKAREEEAARLEEQRRQQEAERAELERQAAAMRAEQARIARLTAMIAEIRAAATGHEHATAADLYEARVAVAALDTSEAVYQELAPLANAAQMATMATLDKLHSEACDREIARAEVERVLSIPLPLTIPDEDTQPGAPAPVAQDGVAENPVQPEPAACFTVGDLAAESVAGDEAAATAVDSPAPGVMAPTLTLGKFNEFIAPLKIDAAGLEAMGFAATKVHNAKLYHDTDKARMVAAMVQHLQGLAA